MRVASSDGCGWRWRGPCDHERLTREATGPTDSRSLCVCGENGRHKGPRHRRSAIPTAAWCLPRRGAGGCSFHGTPWSMPRADRASCSASITTLTMRVCDWQADSRGDHSGGNRGALACIDTASGGGGRYASRGVFSLVASSPRSCAFGEEARVEGDVGGGGWATCC